MAECTPSPAPPPAAAASPICSGWLQKANTSGKRWKRRYVVANSDIGTLAWFKDNPLFSMSVYRVREEPLGQVLLKGGRVEDVSEETPKAPSPYVLCVYTDKRNQLLSFDDREKMKTWFEFLHKAVANTQPSRVASSRSLLPSTGAGSTTVPKASFTTRVTGPGSSGASAVVPSSVVESFCGYLLKAAPGWRTFQSRFVFLDADDVALKYYDAGPTVEQMRVLLGPGTIPGTFDELALTKLPPIDGSLAGEVQQFLTKGKGSIPLKNASVSLSAWTDDAAGMLATSPTFTITTEAGRVFAFVAPTHEYKMEWASRIQAVIDECDRLSGGVMSLLPASGAGATDEGAAAAPASSFNKQQARRLSRINPMMMKSTARLDVGKEETPEVAAARYLSSKAERAGGYLHKYGYRGGRWTFRYFVLRGSTLSYYVDHTCRTIKGTILISCDSMVGLGAGPTSTTSVTNHVTEHKLYLTAVEGDAETATAATASGSGPRQRTFYFCGESSADAARWVHIILTLINAHRTFKGMPPLPMTVTLPTAPALDEIPEEE